MIRIMIFLSILTENYFIEMKQKYLSLIAVFFLGDGVWEGIRLHKNKLLFIDNHLDRLFESAKGISLNIPLTKKEILNEISKVLIKII